MSNNIISVSDKSQLMIYFVVFWVVTPCSLVGGINASEELTASMFRVDVPFRGGRIFL
jgi:hypothetical protein